MKEETIPNEIETCDAITKDTAFEETYKGWMDRVLCEENPCLRGFKKRNTEDRCMDEVRRYVCPLYEGITKKLFTSEK